jgi:hypothetical protein
VAAGAQDDLQGAAPLELNHRICPAGEVLVDIDGELDSATAGLAAAGVLVAFDLDKSGWRAGWTPAFTRSGCSA